VLGRELAHVAGDQRQLPSGYAQVGDDLLCAQAAQRLALTILDPLEAEPISDPV